MKFKLLCTDIDGTLLNKERKLSDHTISAIKRIHPQIPVVLISSRMPKAMRHLQRSLGIEGTPMIAYNGGLILHNSEVIETTEIELSALTTIVEWVKKTKIHLSVYHHDDWFVPTMDYWAQREQNNTQVAPEVQTLAETLDSFKRKQSGVHKVMAMGDEREIEQLFDWLTAQYSEALHLYRSKPTYIEIAHKSISKETALKKLLVTKYPKVGMNEVIAFGDNYNDIAMLTAVGTGIAVANAKQEVLVIADEITAANIEDGVAKSIRKYFLSP